MPAAHAPMPSAEALAEPLRSRWSPSVCDDRHELDGAELETLLHADLGVPDHFRVMTGIAIGVPGDPDDVDERTREPEQRGRRREPLRAIAYGDSWGAPWTAGPGGHA